MTIMMTMMTHPLKNSDRTLDVLARFNALTAEQFPDFEPLALNWECPVAEEDHVHSFRQFAHVFHMDGFICTSSEIDLLADRHIYGLIAHEFGHVIADGIWDETEERDADDAVLEVFGVQIHYGGALNLEYLNKEDLEKLLRR